MSNQEGQVASADGSLPAARAGVGLTEQNITVDGTNTSTLNPSDVVVEPKQQEQAAATELGKGKVVLIMSALCVSPAP